MPLGTTTLASLRTAVARRLNDSLFTIWGSAEIDRYLLESYRLLAHGARIFWDWAYAENLPRGFSYNHSWEVKHLTTSAHGFNYGRANFTAAFEEEAARTSDLALTDLSGPANHTMPAERTQRHLRDASASEAIPALADLPSDIIELDRVLWGTAALDAAVPRDFELTDSRYEITAGDLHSYIWQKDGIHTLRKVRVPAALATVFTVTGHWGVLRDPRDLSTETVTGDTEDRYPTFSYNHTWEQPYALRLGTDYGRATYNHSWESTANLTDLFGPANHTSPFEHEPPNFVLRASATGTTNFVTGIPRRVPAHHGFGYTPWGLARRAYDDTNNVRVEMWREGRAVSEGYDIFEVPDRYTVAMRDYCLYRCLARPGEGQDVRLSGVYQLKWNRATLRLARRAVEHRRNRVGRFGGEPARPGRPPRPKLPYQYGQRVR